jgi:hypothetical protein
MSPIELTIGIVVLVLAIIAAVFIPLRRMAARRTEEVRARFPNARLIVPGANYFGQESESVMQVRGNGTLVLTDSELYFEYYWPRKEFRVPLASIVALETTKWHKGKSVGRPLFKVIFRGDGGREDSAAWYVPDLEGTIRTLEEARQENN